MHRALAVLSAALLVQGGHDDHTFTPWSPGLFTPSPADVPCLAYHSPSSCHGKRQNHGSLSYSCVWLSNSGMCVSGLNSHFHETAEDVIEAWKIAVIVISIVIVVGIMACVVACCCCCQNQKEVIVVQQQQPAAHHHHQQPVGGVPPHQYPAQQYPAQGVPVEMGAPQQGVAVEMSEPDCNPSCQPQV
eukprot:Rhum_TRINITY_DN10832_c0_g1::Rhum_TRINITY_DN10832_c0_g1_i1::g.40682::m.40682